MENDLDLSTRAKRFAYARSKTKRPDGKPMSQMDVAKALGISQQSVEKMENGRVQKPKYLPEAAKLFNVNYEWILDGKGPMRFNTDEWYQKRIEFLRALSEEDRSRFDQIMQFTYPEQFKQDN